MKAGPFNLCLLTAPAKAPQGNPMGFQFQGHPWALGRMPSSPPRLPLHFCELCQLGSPLAASPRDPNSGLHGGDRSSH